ncbi:probable receptor-like protein kinase At5g20050 [Amaranthus tricolor]|uniref:probable receptor-like protein kinase At5g20050 n=1 Tax=Amaranthus tricolor TaxID=29722 RepID=UPI002590AA0B|nr:probable receptor-like protein kinase At5g20050 [Amaranthus tricolor]
MQEQEIRLRGFLLLTAILIIVVIAAFFLKASWIFFTILGIAVIVIFGIVYRIFTLQEKVSRDKGFCTFEKESRHPTKFPYEELVLATNNFSSILGKGGSACVFRGMLKNGTCIAVKRIEDKERGEKEFRAEVAAIGCVQHMNLVRLYGYCIIPKGPRCLVYEFVQNGSLDRWIFPQEHNKSQKPEGCLSWKQRCRVSIDVARALNYLHSDCQSRILHLDVKPENILLDDNYRALVSDFGLAKLMGKEESMVVTRIRGTRGYLAPEWILEKGVSTKSDVYSYGMLLLELIGGRRNVVMSSDGDRKGKSLMSDMKSWEYFPKIVFEKLKAGKIMEVVDKRLLEEKTIIDENEVRRLVCVSLWCIQEKVKMRPNMGQVVNMLEGRLPVDEPPETKMFLHDLLLMKMEKAQGWHKINATALQIS